MKFEKIFFLLSGIILLLSMQSYLLGNTIFVTNNSEEITVYEDFCSIKNLMGLLANARAEFEKKYKEEPSILCKNCKQKILVYSEFEGGIIAKMILAFINKQENFYQLKEILNACMYLLKYGTYEELVTLLLQASNNVSFECSSCHSSTWIAF